VIDPEGLAAWLRLTLIPGIGGESQRKLLAAFGLPEAVFAAGRLAARSVIGDRADLLFDHACDELLDRSLKCTIDAWVKRLSSSS
jgi:DNA processing protein